MYEVNIGLEVHVQLKTRTKMFCGCPATFGAPPNTNVCPVCLGYPGALPVINEEAIRLCARAGLLLGCEISRYSKFDRKNYFYPDMPKNYQISQYDKPLCLGGGVTVAGKDGAGRKIGLIRIHQEEDVAKNTHIEGASLVDFNRAGAPLMEIVTRPDIRSADEAMALLIALKQILVYGDISDCNLEQGNMRCDVNCSVRPTGRDALGVKTEIKNMNTFKGVHAALSYEIKRQIDLIENGGAVIQETRRWDPDIGVTESMRTKEADHDYRYFPEPDLLPVVPADDTVEAWRRNLPELPEARKARFIETYGLPVYDAEVLVADRAVGDYFEEAARVSGHAKAASNWVMTEVLRVLSESGMDLASFSVSADRLARLIQLVDDRTVSSSGAKDVWQIMIEQGGEPEDIVRDRGMAQVSDKDALSSMVDQVLAENAASVEDYRNGKKAAIQFLMGQVMRRSKGKANPPMVMQLLEEKLH